VMFHGLIAGRHEYVLVVSDPMNSIVLSCQDEFRLENHLPISMIILAGSEKVRT